MNWNLLRDNEDFDSEIVGRDGIVGRDIAVQWQNGLWYRAFVEAREIAFDRPTERFRVVFFGTSEFATIRLFCDQPQMDWRLIRPNN